MPDRRQYPIPFPRDHRFFSKGQMVPDRREVDVNERMGNACRAYVGLPPGPERREFEPRRQTPWEDTPGYSRRLGLEDRRLAQNSNQARRQEPKEERVGKERRGTRLGRRKGSSLGRPPASLERRDDFHFGYLGRRHSANDARRKADGTIADRRVKSRRMHKITYREELHAAEFPSKEERVGKKRRGTRLGRRKNSRLATEIPASLNRRSDYLYKYMGRRCSLNGLRRMTDGTIADRRPLVTTVKEILQAGTTLFETFPDRRDPAKSLFGRRKAE